MRFRQFLAAESAATAPEYGLAAAVFAMALLGAASMMGWSFPGLLGNMDGARSAAIAP